MGGPHRGPPITAPHNNGEQCASEIEARREDVGASRCDTRHGHLKSDARVILTDDDIPQLRVVWDEKIADLVGGIPLELPP